MSARLFPPRAPTAGLRPDDLPAECDGRSAVVAVLLDRHGVCTGENLTQHPHHSDHHDAEQQPTGQQAGWLFHKGDRRLDGDLSRVRVRRLYRVLHHQHAGSQTEVKDDR